MSMKRLNHIDYYLTSDLAIATTISLFYPLDCLDKTNPKRVQFIFKRSDGMDQFIEMYWKGEIKVNPLEYFQQLKFLKSRLYESR